VRLFAASSYHAFGVTLFQPYLFVPICVTLLVSPPQLHLTLALGGGEQGACRLSPSSFSLARMRVQSEQSRDAKKGAAPGKVSPSTWRSRPRMQKRAIALELSGQESQKMENRSSQPARSA
jgi:hypothetical protein